MPLLKTIQRFLLSTFISWGSCALAQSTALPAAVQAAFDKQRIPTASVGIFVAAADALASPQAPLLAWQADTALNPASVMKLVSTYAALDTLGAAYVWRTRVLMDGYIDGTVLRGNVYIVGAGDPALAGGQLWELLWKLKGLGVHTIEGDIVLDHSAFATLAHDAGAFDGEPHRPYNAAPDALLLHHKSQILHIYPDEAAGVARLVWSPPLGATQRPTTVALAPKGTACGDWRSRLGADFSSAHQVRLTGTYAASCGTKSWPFAPAEPASFAPRAVLGMWHDIGGIVSGAVRAGTPSAEAKLLWTHDSPALSQVIHNINKYSNNVMTQQLVLSMAREVAAAQLDSAFAASPSAESPAALIERLNHPQTALPPSAQDCQALMSHTLAAAHPPRAGQPALERIHSITPAHGRCAVQTWWTARFSSPAPALDNGAGLSRRARISARALGQMLQHGWSAAAMPEFMGSMPIAGTDGTLRRSRTSAVAHLKTGSLRGVNALAGYVLGASGRRYVLVALINHDNAGAARPALDALTDWVSQH